MKQPVFFDEAHVKAREDYKNYMSIPSNRIRTRQQQRKRYHENPEQNKGHQEKYEQRHPGKLRESKYDYRRRNPEKNRAQVYAIRNIPLKANCEVCGGTEGLARHHPDYSKPLEVLTLCKTCHVVADRIRQLTTVQRAVVLANRHCSTCNKVFPHCSNRKVPSFKGKYACTFWEEKIVVPDSTKEAK